MATSPTVMASTNRSTPARPGSGGPGSGLYRSSDGGDTWTRINPDHRFRQRAWYYSHIFADPVALDTVYVLNTGAFRSTNGGKDFELLPAPHGDHHALWIDPRDPKRLINGNDGGASISVDGGRTWTQQDNQPTAQFYHVAVDNHWPYRVYGAQQDSFSVAIVSRTDTGVIGREDWYAVGGGESGYIAPDPRDPEIVYANAESGQISRYDHRTDNSRDVSMYPLDVSGNGAAQLEYRIQWTEPLFVSPHDSNVLYTAAQFVLKSADQGRSWRRISADLTRNDKSKQQPSGGPITLDITSVEYYDTVFALAESPLQKELLWAGTDDGLIHLTRNDGGNWENVTPKDMPPWSMVSIPQSVPLEVVLDPRLKDTVTEQDIAGHWDLAMKANDVEALHRAVNQMRTLRSDLETMKKWAGGKPDAKALLDSADAFDKKMRPIEEQLIQVNMKASEDNLRFPNQLNEQYDTFVATVDGDDVRPTEPQRQVFAELHRRLTEQLAKWKSMLDTDLPVLNTAMHGAGVPSLSAPAGD